MLCARTRAMARTELDDEGRSPPLIDIAIHPREELDVRLGERLGPSDWLLLRRPQEAIVLLGRPAGAQVGMCCHVARALKRPSLSNVHDSSLWLATKHGAYKCPKDSTMVHCKQKDNLLPSSGTTPQPPT